MKRASAPKVRWTPNKYEVTIFVFAFIVLLAIIALCSVPELLVFFELNEDGASYSVAYVASIKSKVAIPASHKRLPVTGIAEQAFYSSSLKTIVFKEQCALVSIGDYAFANCNNLTGIQLPDSVVSIGEYAFSACTQLKDIVLADGLKYIGSSAFQDCRSLKQITIPKSVISIGKLAFSAYRNDNMYLSNIVFADNSHLETLGEQAFYGCARLTSIALPENLKIIGENAFERCGLTNIAIPASVESICTFGCNSLQSIDVADANPFYQSIEGVLIKTQEKILTQYPRANSRTEYVVPAEVTGIGDNAFYECNNLISVSMPGVASIGPFAFAYCAQLTCVTLADSLINIAEYAFAYCSSLSAITIPCSVTSIGTGAFFGYNYLASIVVNAFEPPILHKLPFYDNLSDLKIYVPEESLAAYKCAEGWSKYADQIYAI